MLYDDAILQIMCIIVSAETCGLGDVFPPDYFDSGP